MAAQMVKVRRADGWELEFPTAEEAARFFRELQGAEALPSRVEPVAVKTSAPANRPSDSSSVKASPKVRAFLKLVMDAGHDGIGISRVSEALGFRSDKALGPIVAGARGAIERAGVTVLEEALSSRFVQGKRSWFPGTRLAEVISSI